MSSISLTMFMVKYDDQHWPTCQATHDVLRGVRPRGGGFAVGPGTTHRGHHRAVQRALGTRGAGLALDPDSHSMCGWYDLRFEWDKHI